MRVIRSISECAGERVGIALGTFDGMHLGHTALINKLIEKCSEHNAKSMVYTFSNVPAELFLKTPLRIFDEERKIKAVEKLNADILVLNDFNEAYAAKEAESFVEEISEKLSVAFFVIGNNYTFGYKKRGTAEFLKEMAGKKGIPVYIQEDVEYKGGLVSSTRIRGMLKEGNVKEANEIMLMPFAVSGKVEHGQHKGTKLGFATMNMCLMPWQTEIKRGVYITKTIIDEKEYPSITNIGTRPTVCSSEEVFVETHVFSYNSDAYGKNISIELLEMIRAEKKFSDEEELKKQVARDMEKAFKYHGIL